VSLTSVYNNKARLAHDSDNTVTSCDRQRSNR